MAESRETSTKFSRRAVGFRGIVNDLAAKTDDFRYRSGEFRNGQVFAESNVDELRTFE